MPVYQMRAPNGRTYRVTGPAGATDEQVRAEILRQFPEAAGAPKVKPKPKKKSFWQKAGEYGEAALTGVAEGMRPVAEFAERLNPIDALGDIIEEKIAPGRQAKVKKQKAQQTVKVAKRNPNVFTGGKIVGEIAATAPLIALGGTAVSAMGAAPRVVAVAPPTAQAVQRLGRAISTGGIGTGRTAAQTAAMTTAQRALQAGERVVGGAISGATGAALTDQDVTTGAIFGAGLPVMATVLKRVGGKAIDLFRMSKVKAAQIIREVLGDNVEETRRVLAQLSPDDQRLVQQVLIEAGVEPRAFFGLGKVTAEQFDPDTTARVLAQQAAAREARMAGIAGGATATQTRGSADMARRAVNELTGEAREAALARANVAGRVVPQAETLASAARQQADEMTASGFVPRMRGLEERAAQQAAIMGDTPAIFPDVSLIQQTRGISGAAGTRANQAINAQIGLRGVAQDMESLVADLAAEGMQPLQVAPIVSKILEMAKAPGTRASTLQRRALRKAANQLQALADVNGVIDARDLYQFRKSEIGDIIDVLMSARKQPPSGVKETASGLMTSVKDFIDEAIEGAGGTGWKDYLTRTRQGFETVNRQELAAKGAQLVKEDPDQFIKMMAGERPQMVEDIMGKGTRQYDIGGLALADPQRFNAMMKTAQELNTVNRMRELGAEGTGKASRIMREQRPGLMQRGVGLLLRTKFPALSFATSGTQNVETAIVSPRVLERLAGGYASGNAMRNVMEQYPTAMNVSQAISGMRPITRNVMAQAPARIMQQFPAVDPETGETLIEIGYNEDGSPYPIYGRISAR
jgi:hypothetical protein